MTTTLSLLSTEGNQIIIYDLLTKEGEKHHLRGNRDCHLLLTSSSLFSPKKREGSTKLWVTSREIGFWDTGIFLIPVDLNSLLFLSWGKNLEGVRKRLRSTMRLENELREDHSFLFKSHPISCITCKNENLVTKREREQEWSILHLLLLLLDFFLHKKCYSNQSQKSSPYHILKKTNWMVKVLFLTSLSFSHHKFVHPAVTS